MITRPFRMLLNISWLALLLIFTACNQPIHRGEVEAEGAEYERPAEPLPLHPIRTIDHETFINAITNPRNYEIKGFIVAGVIPHHITAATMISGFFAQAAPFTDHYDLVIILAPNHFGGPADIVLSYRDWGVGAGVKTHRGFVDDALAICGISTAISHHHMETDHAASIFIPFIYHYLPNTMVAPMLLNHSLSFTQTIQLFDWLMDWIGTSGLQVLLVASIDFSHFLTPYQARQRDMVTTAAILDKDFALIHSLCDNYLDSPAALIIFLKYLQALGLSPQIIDHTDASEFLGAGLDETTSYKVIIGAASIAIR